MKKILSMVTATTITIGTVTIFGSAPADAQPCNTNRNTYRIIGAASCANQALFAPISSNFGVVYLTESAYKHRGKKTKEEWRKVLEQLVASPHERYGMSPNQWLAEYYEPGVGSREYEMVYLPREGGGFTLIHVMQRNLRPDPGSWRMRVEL